jgi:8-oxo-dGTP diphosphatase
MSLTTKILASSETLWQTCIPHISIDNVIFGFHDSQLNVLLLKISVEDKWALPGGYVQREENVSNAAARVLKERTGVTGVFLQQFSTFGNINRSEGYFKDYPDDLWHKQRFISISHYALVDHTKVIPVTDEFSPSCEWKAVAQLPAMVMDHRQILVEALSVLRDQLKYKPIGYNLLPEEFALSELQNLYEAIFGLPLNRGNFYRKVTNDGFLIKLPKTRKGGAHKAPDLYKFDAEKYSESLKSISW